MNKQEKRKLRKRVSIGIFAALGLIIIMLLLPKELSDQEADALQRIEEKVVQINEKAEKRSTAKDTPTTYVDIKKNLINKQHDNITQAKKFAEQRKLNLRDKCFGKEFTTKKEVEEAETAAKDTEDAIGKAQETARNALHEAIQHAKDIRICVDELTPKSKQNKESRLASILNDLSKSCEVQPIDNAINTFKENSEACKTDTNELTRLWNGFNDLFYNCKSKYNQKCKNRLDDVANLFSDVYKNLNREKASYTNFWSYDRDNEYADILATANEALQELVNINIEDIKKKLDEKKKELEAKKNKNITKEEEKIQEAPIILVPGEAELSICVQSKTLADDLVIQFLRDWWKSKNYTIEDNAQVRTKLAQNGIRYELTKNGESWKTDVIYPSEQMQEQKSHLSFSIASTRNTGQIEEIICSDALVFIPQKGETTKMSEEAINTASKTWDANNSYHGKAVELLFGQTSPQAGEDSLKIGVYHVRADRQRALDILMPQGVKGAQEAPGRGWTLELNELSIANQTYNYSFHIRSQKRAGASKYAEEFHKYMKDNSKLISDYGFVPFNTQVDQNIQKFDKDDENGKKPFPFERILAFMKELKQDKDIKETIEGLGYSEGTKYLRGFEFPFALFFDTDNDEEMKQEEKDGSVEVISQEILDRVKKEIDETIQGLPYDHLMVVVTGHADVRGEERYNQNLSQNRAMTLTNAVLTNQLPKLKNYAHKQYEQPKTVEEPEKKKNVLILSIGCSSKCHMVSKKENITGKAADDYYRRDRRASIFIIVPSSEKR